jgi:hypothetical protein
MYSMWPLDVNEIITIEITVITEVTIYAREFSIAALKSWNFLCDFVKSLLLEILYYFPMHFEQINSYIPVYRRHL